MPCEFLTFSGALSSGIPPCMELSAQDKARCKESQIENRRWLHVLRCLHVHDGFGNHLFCSRLHSQFSSSITSPEISFCFPSPSPFRSAFCADISLGFPKENPIFLTLVTHLPKITLSVLTGAISIRW